MHAAKKKNMPLNPPHLCGDDNKNKNYNKIKGKGLQWESGGAKIEDQLSSVTRLEEKTRKKDDDSGGETRIEIIDVGAGPFN